MYEFILDYREKKLITFFSEKLKDVNHYKTSNLDLGDIILRSSYPEQQLEQINISYEIIIERKEINDLVSSIKDKRYKEQKARIQAQVAANKHKTELIYLIEGSVSKLRNPRNDKMFYGSIISMLLRDNIKLIFTESIEDTCNILHRMYLRLITKPHEFINCAAIVNNENCLSDIQLNEPENTDLQKEKNKVENLENTAQSEIKSIDISLQRGGSYLNSRVKKKKSDNITPANCGTLMLTYLPGVSTHIAHQILNNYNNKISELVTYISSSDIEECDKIKNLASIKIKTITDKTRNLGPSIAKTLIQYLK